MRTLLDKLRCPMSLYEQEESEKELAQLDEIKVILQKACDRDWKDETLYQTAVIASNAIYWRDREIELLKKRSSEAVEREAGLELGADMCIRMARSESSVGHDKEASILEAAAFGIRALKRHGVSPHSDTEERK